MQTIVAGVWGGAEYNNPVQGAPGCPAGYTPKIAWGTDNLDWLFRWCYK
jgi:hypothetical protein